MPAAAVNLFERARIKAFANEHRIKSVPVTGGKLVVEPIEVPSSKMTTLRRAGGRFLADKGRLTLPVRFFNLEESDNLLGPIARLLDRAAVARPRTIEDRPQVRRAYRPVRGKPHLA